jgi:ADP-heptose:LPS heptosyltransferase
MQGESRKPSSEREHSPLILVTQMGGVGDVVLTSQLFASLRNAFPSAAIDLACRCGTVAMAELYPVKPNRVIGLDCDPIRWAAGDETAAAEIRACTERFESYTADLVIAAEYRPNPLGFLAAGVIGAKKIISTWPAPVGDPRYPAGSSSAVETVPVGSEAHVLDRLNALSTAAGATPAPFPQWSLPEHVARNARAFLETRNISWKDFTLVFPFGAVGAEHKRWPIERFAAVLNAIRSAARHDIVLIGTAGERPGLESLREMITGEGEIAIYSGAGTDLQTACGIVAGARSFLGNDTGPMHVAGAYGVPGVAIFGGGHWPAYKPWAAGAIGIVEQLPCFGCDWDCVLGHGLCVEAIGAGQVLEALRVVEQRGSGAAPEVRRSETVSPAIVPILRDASRRFQKSQADRAERYQAILQLKEVTTSQQARIAVLDRVAAERLEALEASARAYEEVAADSEKRREQIDELTRLIGVRNTRIRELQAESSDRMKALEVESAALHGLRQEADFRTAALKAAGEAMREKDRLIASSQTAADERLRLLMRADEEYKRLAADAEQRARDVDTLTEIIGKRDETIARLREVAAERLDALLSTTAALEELRVEAEKRSAGLHELTAIVHANEELVVELRRIADERLAALNERADAVAVKDQRIDELERNAREESAADPDPMAKTTLRLKREIEILELQIIALEKESLYNFLIRRWGRPHRTVHGSS